MRKIIKYIKLIFGLGLWNVAYVLWYRFTLRIGIRKFFFPPASISSISIPKDGISRDYNLESYRNTWEKRLLKSADAIINGRLCYFAYHDIGQTKPPDWFLNPFSQAEVSNPRKHWTELSDFDLGIGDIKTIWDPSRFGWALTLARAYAISGNREYIDTLEAWINNWCRLNPVNIGPNWKCGQETSIRLFHIISVSNILEERGESSCFTEFVKVHLERIKPNINYAFAQDNNHGTSEAAALYIGSVWMLLKTEGTERKYERWAKEGLRMLEERIASLIMNDGTFSQYAIVYHRMVLDTFAWVLWNEDLLAVEERLDQKSLKRIDKAIHWLECFIDDKSGDAPNFGPNDGTSIFQLDSHSYREFRPSIRRIKVLRAIPISGGVLKEYDESLFWMKINPAYSDADTDVSPGIQQFSEGGFIKQRGKNSWLLFHYPIYKFRPSHCDFLHVDLWHKGKNILRDAGSYSYNTQDTEKWKGEDYKSIFAHNTIILNKKNPIPAVGRFLYADWPMYNSLAISEDTNTVSADYSYGDIGNHCREIKYLSADRWLVSDTVQGSYRQVMMKWRLHPGEWEIDIEARSIECELAQITVDSNGADIKFEIIEEPESRFYKQKRLIPVLQFTSDETCTHIQTTIELR